MNYQFKHIFKCGHIIIVVHAAANESVAWDMLKSRLAKLRETDIFLPEVSNFKLVSEKDVSGLI